MLDLKTVSIAAVVLAFFSFHLSSLAGLAEAVGRSITPWVFAYVR